MRKSKSVDDNGGMMVKPSKDKTSGVKVTEVKDDDVSDTDSDSDYVESYEEQVSNSTKRSTARSDTFEVVPIEKSTK